MLVQETGQAVPISTQAETVALRLDLDLSGNLSAIDARYQSNTTVSALVINKHQSTSYRTGAETGLVLFAQVVPIPRLEGN